MNLVTWLDGWKRYLLQRQRKLDIHAANIKCNK